MPEHYRDDAIVNPETQHEKTDVSVRALMVFIALFIVFAILTHVAIWLLFKGFVRIERRRQLGPVTAMQRPADMAVPKEQPLLQPSPRNGANGKTLPPYRSTPVTDLAGMREGLGRQRQFTGARHAVEQRVRGVGIVELGQVIRNRDGEAAGRCPGLTESVLKQVPDARRDLDRRQPLRIVRD